MQECKVTYFVLASLIRALANNIGHNSDWHVVAGRSSLLPSSNGIESSTVTFLQQPWKKKGQWLRNCWLDIIYFLQIWGESDLNCDLNSKKWRVDNWTCSIFLCLSWTDGVNYSQLWSSQLVVTWQEAQIPQQYCIIHLDNGNSLDIGKSCWDRVLKISSHITLLHWNRVFFQRAQVL